MKTTLLLLCWMALGGLTATSAASTPARKASGGKTAPATPAPVESDEDKLTKYNEVKAKAEAGDAESQMKMSGYALNPPVKSIQKSASGQLDWMVKAAKQDYPAALDQICVFYLNQAKAKKNNPDDLAEAYKWMLIRDKFSGNSASAAFGKNIGDGPKAEGQKRADAYFAEKTAK
ncbi:MAG: hypothetical protein WCJ96_07440 [Verrucomicrobiota bacterium]|jgi:hypothetical protein